ncbi:23S rRNA (pseudouridine(1915)-N(3))-methyltransferase RlmH [Endothiovibrio diazotrophicus]
MVAVGQKMPGWVEEGYREYAQRLPRECALELKEIPPGRRGKGADIQRAIREEGERMLAALPKEALVIALDERGRERSTEQLADELGEWLQGGRDVVLLVGGPDGLAAECKGRAERTWGLSKLTLPHPLVRVVVAEQIYRAWSLLKGHPYHRA